MIEDLVAYRANVFERAAVSSKSRQCHHSYPVLITTRRLRKGDYFGGTPLAALFQKPELADGKPYDPLVADSRTRICRPNFIDESLLLWTASIIVIGERNLETALMELRGLNEPTDYHAPKRQRYLFECDKLGPNEVHFRLIRNLLMLEENRGIKNSEEFGRFFSLTIEMERQIQQEK